MNIQNAIELITSVTGKYAADFASLKKLYKKAALLCHTDKNVSDDGSATMKDLNLAWEFLSKREEQVNRSLKTTSGTPTPSFIDDPILDHELYDSPLPTFQSRESLIKQAFNIVEDITWNAWVDFKYKTVYFREFNVRIHTYAHCIRITELSNALEARKTCREYSISWDSYGDQEGYIKFLDYVSEISNTSCISGLLAHLHFTEFETGRRDQEIAELSPGIKVSRYELKSGRIFSPFKLHKIKPLTAKPEKFRVSHLIKIVANGQYKQLIQSQYLTDDYARDAENKFGRKVYENPFPLLVDLIEGRHAGFHIFPRADNRYAFGAHMNDSKSVILVIENRFPAVDFITGCSNSKYLQ